jgi:uncharacterized protein (TIGR02679 family)
MYILMGEDMSGEILRFFKSESGFDRLLRAMYDAYNFHGRAFGAVRLTRPSAKEEAAISEFFRRDYFNQALIRISLADFERQMQKNFDEILSGENISLGEVLKEYIGKPSERKKPSTFAMTVLGEVLPDFLNTPAEAWLKEISTQTRRVYRAWSDRFLNAPKDVTDEIRAAAAALNNVPMGEKLVPLADYFILQESAISRRVVTHHEAHQNEPKACFVNSHDELFLKALACRFGADEKEKLYLCAGLIANGAISHVTVRGVLADDAACARYENANESHVLTLENLNHLNNVSAYGKVFIIEDPLIFAAVNEQLRHEKITLVNACNSSAFLYLLKLFKNTPLYYAGNMDCKGLVFADKLYLRHKNFIPWRYSREDYECVLSEGSVVLPNEKKNLALHNEQFASLLSLLKKSGKTASSIPLLPYFIEDIRNIVQ